MFIRRHSQLKAVTINFLVSVFKLFPFVNEIADALAGSKREKEYLLRLIADIALWNTTRASNKAFFPVAMLISVARLEKRYVDFFSGIACPNTRILDTMVPLSIQTMDFSGLGAYRFWSSASLIDYKIRRSEDMTTQTAKEFVFHAVWGTAKEDLGLLEWMTGHAFQTRREMGKQFLKRGEGQSIRTFNLITFHRICKLANASQTNYLAGGKGQCSRSAVFSGECNQRVSIESDLFKTLQEGQADVQDARQDITKVVARLSRVKENIQSKIVQENVVRFGTTKFFVPDVTYSTYGEPVNDVPYLTGRYFFGNEE